MALLGVIALAGMIMRNTVILVDQIDHDLAAGATPWDAIVESTVRRARPVVLTALAAILAMIPLARSVFWGPMALAIMGGADRGDGADAVLPARALCRVVPRQARQRGLGSGHGPRTHSSAPALGGRVATTASRLKP